VGPPGRSSTSCRASRTDGGPAGAGLGPGGPGPAGGRPMPGSSTGMEDRQCGHPAPLQSTKARYQVLPPGDRLGRVELNPDLAVLGVAIRMPIGVEHECVAAGATAHRRGYPHRRWNCLRRCSGPPTSAWRDGSGSSWRCPLSPSGSTGAPAGADPPDRPPLARCRSQSPGRSSQAGCGSLPAHPKRRRKAAPARSLGHAKGTRAASSGQAVSRG
jgi:hypothetical protein